MCLFKRIIFCRIFAWNVCLIASLRRSFLQQTILHDLGVLYVFKGKTVGSWKSYAEQVIPLFTSYCVFNFHYPQNAAPTLEFIQGYVFLNW